MAAVVTGGNAGIGLAVVHALAARGTPVVLTARNAGRGEAALQEVLQRNPGAKVRFALLDVMDPNVTLAAAAAQELCADPNPISLLVNNAGVGGDLPWQEVADEDRAAIGEQIVTTNFRGLLRVTESLRPLLRAGAAVVHVSSGAAFLNMEKMSLDALGALRAARSPGDLEALAARFIVRYGAPGVPLRSLDAESGFHMQAYGFSKALVARLTQLQAKAWPELVVTCCSPGFCATSMTKDYAKQEDLIDVAEGAQIVLSAETTPTGLFVGKQGTRDAVPPVEQQTSQM